MKKDFRFDDTDIETANTYICESLFNYLKN